MRKKAKETDAELAIAQFPESRRKSGALRGGHDPRVIGKATQFKPGQSGNPGGRRKNDLAKEIAQAVFENNAEAICKTFGKALLNGDASTFKVLAERAYGKIKEQVEQTGLDETPITVTVKLVSSDGNGGVRSRRNPESTS